MSRENRIMQSIVNRATSVASVAGVTSNLNIAAQCQNPRAAERTLNDHEGATMVSIANQKTPRTKGSWPRRTTLTAGLLALMPIVSSAHAGSAHTPHPFKSASIKLGTMPGSTRLAEPVLRVGNNGRRYTHLKGKVSVPVAINAKVKSGHSIARWMVTRRDPTILDISQGALLDQFISGLANGGSYFGHRPTLTLSASNFVSVSADGGIALTAAQSLIGQCNERFPSLPASDEAIALYNYQVNVGFWSHTNGRVAIARKDIPVRIICTAKATTAIPDPTPFKVERAQLSYSATGKKCPRKMTIRTVIESNRPGNGFYQHERKGGQSSGWIAFQTKKVGSRYLFVRHETQEVGNVDQVRRILVMNGPVAPWKRFKIDCDKFKVTHVKYFYKIKVGSSCPRPMTTFMSLHANQKGHAWVRHERRGGAAGKWFKVTFKKTNNSYVAFIKNTQKVGNVDQVRRLRVKKGPVSKWVHFKNDCAPMKVSKVQLGILVSKQKACPKTVTFKSWVFGTKEGWAKVRYRKAGGGKSAWYVIKVRKGSGGVYVGSHAVKRKFSKSARTKYMAEAQNGGKVSRWVPLRLNCPIGPTDLGKAKAKQASRKSARERPARPTRFRRSRTKPTRFRRSRKRL